MAAVTIPRLQQIQSSTGPRNDRLDFSIKDQAENILGRTQVITSVAEKGLNLFQKIEEDKITQLSYDAELEYENWTAQKLPKLQTIKGDPTKAYSEFEDEEAEKIEEIISKNPDLNERIKEGLTSNLRKAYDKNRVRVLGQRAVQDEVYKSDNYEAILTKKGNDLPSFAANIKKGDTTSTKFFNQTIEEMQTIIAKRGLEVGTAKEVLDPKSPANFSFTENGKETRVMMDQGSLLRFVKEKDKGIFTTVSTMIDSGEREKAQLVFDKYKDSLTDESTAKLLKKFEEEGKVDEANNLIGQIESKPEDARLSEVEKIKDQEVKQKVLDRLATNATKRQILKTQQEDKNYDLFLKNITVLKKSGKVYGISDVENNLALKSLWGKLSGKQQKSIEEEFNAPKKSDPKVMVEAQEIILGDISSYTPAKFQEKIVGLSEGDKSKMWTAFTRKKNNEEKNSDTTRIYRQASDMLKNKLVAAKLLDKNKEERLATAYDQLIGYVEGVPPNTPVEKLSEYVDKFVAAEKKTELFGGGEWFSRTQELPKNFKAVPPKSTITNDDPLKGLDSKQVFNLQKSYKRALGIDTTPALNDPTFLNYVRGLK